MKTFRVLPIAALLLSTAACGASDATTDTTAAPAAAATTAAEDKAMSETTAAMEDKMEDEAMTDTTATHDSMADDSMEDESKTDESMADESMEDKSGDAMAGPAFAHMTLTDVDGTSFTLADFAGKPVFVESFATWCPKCKSQLDQTNAAAAELGDDAVFVALSVEADLDAGDVAKYAADNGFSSVRFAVMTPEFLAAITADLGPDAANPPSTPHFIIDSKGEVGEVATGTEDSAAIVEAMRAA